jgi:NTE family protein
MLLRPANATNLSSLVSGAPLFTELTEATRAAIAEAMRDLEVAPGDSPFSEDDRIDALYIVREGALRAVERGPNGEGIVRTIGAGELLDQLQTLAGGVRPVRVLATERSRLAVIPGDVVDALVATHADLRHARERLHRRQLFCRLHGIFGAFDAEFLDELEAAASWTHVERGDSLFAQGDPSTTLYFVISGRLQTMRREPNGVVRTLAESGRGDAIGENDFFTGEPHVASVRAVRDSVVVGVTSQAFDALVAKRPHLLRHITRHIVEQHRRPTVASATSGRVATIAIVSLGTRVRMPDFTERLTTRLSELGSVTRLSSQIVNERMAEPGIAQTTEESADCERLLAWLEGQETKHRFVVYEADPTATEWTRRCLRQADRIVLVAHAHDDPAPGALERELLLGQGRITDAVELLVLVHPDGTRMPSGTNRWLQPRPHVEEHRHVRWTEDADFGRLARILAGRAVGIVLGGGGARGFAHIGILRALREAEIPIDMIGGTSMGAALAAQWALGGSADEIREINHRIWVQMRPHTKLTLPIVSIVGNTLAAKCGRMMYGETEIEDLWIPFFCVSSNLTTAEVMVHRRGSLLDAATASASLPGFAVPTLHGKQLLCDGGVLNNLPTDIMRQLGAGTVIASEVSLEDDTTFLAERVPTPWEVLRRRAKFPSVMEVILRASLLHSTRRQQIALDESDFTLHPPVEGFSMMDFPKLSELIDLGYRYARETIATWRDRDLPFPIADVTRERRAAPMTSSPRHP